MTKLKGIKVSDELHKYLLARGTKSDSFEEIIWRLIGMKEIKKEDKNQTPSDYIPKLNTGKQKR